MAIIHSHTLFVFYLTGLTKKIARNGSTLAEYSYLADGARLSAVGSDGTGVRYLGSLIYSRASDGTLSLDCALTPGGRIVRTAGAGTSGSYQVQHFLRDHLGSVRTVVDGATGGVLETSDYLPLGRRWDLTGGQSSQTVTDPTNRWRFSGKESQAFFDQDIPYSDFGARLHDPRTGRWLAPDPLAEKYYGHSQFGYCAGDPVLFYDRNGFEGVKYINENGNKTIETNIVVLTKPKIRLPSSKDLSEKQINRINKRNDKIEKQNQGLITMVHEVLNKYYNGDIGGSYDSSGNLVSFKFNVISQESDNVFQTNGLHNMAYFMGIPCKNPFGEEGRAAACILSQGSTMGNNGLHLGNVITFDPFAPESVIPHEVGHSFKLHDTPYYKGGIMNPHPTSSLTAEEVDNIWFYAKERI